MTPVVPSCRKSTAAAPMRRRQHAVEHRRRAAALHVPEHRHARLDAGPLLRSPPPAACRCRASRAARARTGRPCPPASPDSMPSTSRALRDDDDAESPRTACAGCTCAHARRRASIGSSGMMIRSAPPPTPPAIASQPASRPITSTTITRRCDFRRRVQPVQRLADDRHRRSRSRCSSPCRARRCRSSSARRRRRSRARRASPRR